MLNDRSSLSSHLATRRSAKPRSLIEPGPNGAQLRRICETALRTPDHGKLAPWRFVIVEQDQRAELSRKLTEIYLADRPEAGRLELESIDQFARQAPALVVALFSPRESSKIPLWEQQLSTGAAVMNLLHAAHAEGFAGGWLTGWASFSDPVRDLFGTASERIAGFIFIGTPGQPLEERARPDADAHISTWAG